MANIQLSWTALTSDPGDVDSLEVYVCEPTAATIKATESDFQTALDAIHGGAALSTQELRLVEASLAWDASSTTSPDSVSATGTYYYCVAAKNAAGYKVGDGSASLAVSSVTV
jgi:hypothetical protein